MKALTFHGIQDIRCTHVPDPKIEHSGDAIVRVTRSAICGSDLHVYFGRESGLDPGTVMGHEFMGEIVEVGSEVPLKSGTMVISPFTTSCGSCYYCREGLTCRCSSGALFGFVENGSGLQGTQAEYVRIPNAAGTLVPVPEGIADEEALLLGDVLSTGYFVADRADIRPGATVAVVGCGPVGLMAIIGARELQAGRIIAIDTIPERLALARSFGAETLDFQTQDCVALVRAYTEGRGADAVLEVVGSAAATRLSIDLLRPGGTLSVAGVHTEPHLAFSPGEAYDKNLTYRVGRCPARYYMDRLIPLLEEKRYNLASIISHRLPLTDGPFGYTIFSEKREGCTKVLLTPPE